jgi:hypothetical protein
MNLDKHLDNGFVILKEKEDVYAPVGMVGYSFYDSLEDVRQYVMQYENQIQVVTGFQSKVKFGKAQQPGLSDYADHTDTIKWLLDNYNAAASS